MKFSAVKFSSQQRAAFGVAWAVCTQHTMCVALPRAQGRRKCIPKSMLKSCLEETNHERAVTHYVSFIPSYVAMWMDGGWCPCDRLQACACIPFSVLLYKEEK